MIPDQSAGVIHAGEVIESVGLTVAIRIDAADNFAAPGLFSQ
jgi:hypothetical protein